jgi:hypothetical protein
MKSESYMTRALRARDPRFARILGKMGYATTDVVADEPLADIHALRALYEDIFGKRPFNGWGADVLSAKITEKRAES